MGFQAERACGKAEPCRNGQLSASASQGEEIDFGCCWIGHFGSSFGALTENLIEKTRNGWVRCETSTQAESSMLQFFLAEAMVGVAAAMALLFNAERARERQHLLAGCSSRLEGHW